LRFPTSRSLGIRHKVSTSGVARRCYQPTRAIFSKVCADFAAELVEMDGEANHVHLLVNYPAKHSIATLLNSLKGVSSSMLGRERPDLRPRYWQGVHRAAKETALTI